MNKTTVTTIIGLLVLALAMTGALSYVHESLNECRAQFVAGALEPMAELLKENQAILTELRADTFVEKDNDILESYLIKIRRDGVAKHADMKQQLDQLAENNTVLVTYITAYAPHAKTAAFSSQANKFRTYAVAWRDRWNSVMELFMVGGNYPAAAVPFPHDLPATVDVEIAATK